MTALKALRTPLMAALTALFLLALTVPWGAGPTAFAAERFVLKYACFAPEGSTYVKNMRAWDAELRERSGGRLSFRIYPGGVQGDERDMLRKVRVGQIHLVGMTGLGLGEVLPAIRILEMPGYYRDFEEVDAATEAADSTLRAMLQEVGFELLGWGEAGTVHIFSKKKLTSLKDLAASKMWSWDGDRISEEIFRVFDIKPIPLALPDVLPSLQSGTIDGVHSSPLGVVALQWAPHVNYMTAQNLGRAMGGTVIDKRRFDALPPDLQALLLETGEKWHRAIVVGARAENERALQILDRQGVEAVTIPPEAWAQLEAGFATVRTNLTGVLWPESLLTLVEGAVEAHRGRAAAPQDAPAKDAPAKDAPAKDAPAKDAAPKAAAPAASGGAPAPR